MSSISVMDRGEMVGRIVPRTFIAGYVVLSYVVSYVGAWTTLELIHRRTAMRGYYNWFLLAGAAVSMGGIAIWCMHFIGNRAITLGEGQSQIQISYSSGFTALSFFIPIIVLFMAFSAVGSNEKVSITRVTLGGALAGFGICGMHYLGQAGISNYTCVYTVAYVVGSAVIAVVASIGALGVFFLFRSAWNTSWWKRAICASLLAGAVSGMHWVASVGTQYRLRSADPAEANTMSGTSTVVVVIVLSVTGCFILLLLTLFAQRRRARSANRAQQVVLAAAVFDGEGRLMVTPEGLLPSRKITNSYIERSFDDVFGVSHPVFHWIFRTTRNWSSVSNLVPGMRGHVHRVGLKGRLGTSEANFLNDEGSPIEDYTVVFRELFCLAAADLAEDFNQPLEKVGILYDEIISTGQKPKDGPKGKKSETTVSSSVDLERDGLGLPVLGKGQLLFLVSKVSRREAEHLQAAGFRFATTTNVVPILATSMQVSRKEINRSLDVMRSYASDVHMLDPGVHLACFAVRASLAAGRGGFDILARKDARNQLPTMQLPIDSLDGWQIDFLKTMDTFTAAACIKHLFKASKSSNPSQKEQEFARILLTTLEALKEEIDDPFFNDSTLIAQPIEAPCRACDDESPPGVAILITFKTIVPIHGRAPGKKLEFTPLNFFRMQQHVYKNSADHAAFARSTYREFAPVLNVGKRKSIDDGGSTRANVNFAGRFFSNSAHRSSRKDVRMGDEIDLYGNSMPALPQKASLRPSKLKFWDRNNSRYQEKIKGDNSSEKNLVEIGSLEGQAYGGIMVSQEVSVNVGHRERGGTPVQSSRDPNAPMGKRLPGIEMRELATSASSKPGIVSSASKEEGESRTFVDELFAICIATKKL